MSNPTKGSAVDKSCTWSDQIYLRVIVSIKLCRTGRAASKAYRELSDILTCIRLRCSRSGKCRSLEFPSRKPQPPKEATRRVDEKRWADAGSGGGGGGIGLPRR